MPYRTLADAILLLHLGFILFAVFGVLLVALRRRWLPVHLAAAAWAVFVEVAGSACPLTSIEIHWRRLAGEAGYQGSFVDHYLLPLIYPAGLTRELQLMLGLGVLAFNAILYTWIWRRRRHRAG